MYFRSSRVKEKNVDRNIHGALAFHSIENCLSPGSVDVLLYFSDYKFLWSISHRWQKMHSKEEKNHMTHFWEKFI